MLTPLRPSKSPTWELPSDGWHWDGSPSECGLLIFSFYSCVETGGGGTLLLSGSHRLIARFYESLSPIDLGQPHRAHRRMFCASQPWLRTLTGRTREPGLDRTTTFMEGTSDVGGIPCRVVELTGEPGDAVFCNLGMLHSAAPNCSDTPRIMRSKFLFLR